MLLWAESLEIEEYKSEDFDYQETAEYPRWNFDEIRPICLDVNDYRLLFEQMYGELLRTNPRSKNNGCFSILYQIYETSAVARGTDKGQTEQRGAQRNYRWRTTVKTTRDV